MATFKELLAQAKTSDEKRAVERAFSRARGKVDSLETAKALGAVGGPKLGGGKAYTIKAGDSAFSVAGAIYGDQRYAEQVAQIIGLNPTVGKTYDLPLLRTGLGRDLKVSTDFMNAALASDARIGYSGAAPQIDLNAAEAGVQSNPAGAGGINQPPQINTNYGGVTLPLQSAGQPLVGDTVRPGAGGNRVLQTGLGGSGVAAPQGFASPTQLQTTQYGGMPAPANVNNPLGTGAASTSQPGLAARKQQQATYEAGLPAFPANVPTTTLAGGQTLPNSALFNPTAPEIDSVYGFGGANSTQFSSTNATLAWSLYEKTGSYEQWIGALNAAGLAATPPEGTQDTGSTSEGQGWFNAYQAGASTGNLQVTLARAARSRARASQARRLPRNYAPSPFTNSSYASGMIDRALSWRIGF